MPKKANETILRPTTSFLFKGRNGTGKSIAAWAKELRPVYTFNIDSRIESVINHYNRIDGHCNDCEYDDFTIASGYAAIDKQLDALVARCEYRTVHIASLTSFIYLILNHLIKTKFGMKRASGAQAGKRIGGIPVNELEDFNAEDSAIINDLIAFFQEIKSQGVNCILEAHITPYEVVTLEDGQRVTTTINQILTKGKKAPASVPGFFNEIWLFNKEYVGVGEGHKSVKYQVITDGTSTDDCKTSWGIKNFDWTDGDFGKKVFDQLKKEFKDTPAADPNRPVAVRF